ncbi:MAG: hypothetical protein AB1401_11595 [Thermodesulfobacteriota bacterium]
MAGKNIRYYSNRQVKKRGKQDGRDWKWKFFPPKWPFQESKQPDPSIDQEEPTEFEEELLRGANESLTYISQEWYNIDKELHENCKNAEDKYRIAKAAVKKESIEHEDAIKNYEAVKARFYNYPMPRISNTLFWILFLIITVAEVASNALVFNVFEQSQSQTLITAVGVMVGIPWLSNFIGKKLRMKNKTKTTIVLITGAVLVVLAGLIVIAVLWGQFFEANNIVEALDIGWDIGSIPFAFFIVNVLLSAVIAIIAYKAGHRDPVKYKQIKRAFEDGANRLKAEAADLEEAAEGLANARIEFDSAHSERADEFEKIKYEAKEERGKWIELVQLYRTSNMLARRNKTRPKSFLVDIEGLISIPEILQNLDCNSCCYEEERR